MLAMIQGSVAASGTGLGHIRGISSRWLRRANADRGADRGAEPETEGDADGLNHGLSEHELRALIAEDLRAFVRRPMAKPPGEGVSPARPFLLDRLVFATT